MVNNSKHSNLYSSFVEGIQALSRGEDVPDLNRLTDRTHKLLYWGFKSSYLPDSDWGAQVVKDFADYCTSLRERKKINIDGEKRVITTEDVAFDSLGDELEAFQEDCESFQKVSLIPVEIKEKCNAFYPQVHKAFEVGYKLDPYVDDDNINEKEANRYLKLLRNLDKRKAKILNLMYAEASKARKQKNFTYYSQLIANYQIKLYSVDYEFMEKHKKIFSKNKRYISHIKYIEYLRAERLKKEKAKRVQYKKSRK